MRSNFTSLDLYQMTYIFKIFLQNVMPVLCCLALMSFVSMVHTQFHVISLEVNFPNDGFFCSHGDIGITYMMQHHCKLTCILSATCVAINYNTSDGLCTQLSIPCARANTDIFTQYIRFTGRRLDKCYQWYNRANVSESHPRLVYNNQGSGRVARLIHPSGYYPCFQDLANLHCWGGTGSLRIDSITFECELLLVDPRCTVGWLPFNGGDALPINVVSSGLTYTGEPMYTTSFYPIGFSFQVIGYYSVESGQAYGTFSGDHRYSPLMELLVIL